MSRAHIVLAAVFLALTSSAQAAEKPNVLFFAVDDLRPQLGCYGIEKMHSPNIDRLAETGFLFKRSYCMVPTCGASRSSLMSGVRPARNRFVRYTARVDEDAPGTLTLNTYFKNQGYHTVSLGKIFHFPQDNIHGWSEAPWRPPRGELYGGHYVKPESFPKERLSRRGRGLPYESADVGDDAYQDGQLASEAITRLQRLAKQEKPFFLAVGFFKPHLPFVAPKKYWDLYDEDDVQLPETYARPKGAPDVAIHTSGELRAYADVPSSGPVSDEMALKLIHGYYACVSYTDAQIGRVLAELDRLGLADNTVVVLWGDHGWNLGEHTMWCKHCCFETSMHAPLLLRAPGFEPGRETDALVEFIDIYPSLCELADLPRPEHLQGTSLVPLLNDPQAKWKQHAIGRYGPGDTIRSDRYRFSLYTDNAGASIGRMLYDHEEDAVEMVNISEAADMRATVEDLAARLAKDMGKPSPRK